MREHDVSLQPVDYGIKEVGGVNPLEDQEDRRLRHFIAGQGDPRSPTAPDTTTLQ